MPVGAVLGVATEFRPGLVQKRRPAFDPQRPVVAVEHPPVIAFADRHLKAVLADIICAAGFFLGVVALLLFALVGDRVGLAHDVQPLAVQLHPLQNGQRRRAIGQVLQRRQPLAGRSDVLRRRRPGAQGTAWAAVLSEVSHAAP